MGALNKYRLLREVRKNQWLKPEALKKLQEKKLRAIIRHAYDNTEFYRRKFDSAGVKPDDIKTVEDLKKIPFTTKQEVRENSTTTLLSRGTNLANCRIVPTSGSTGIPLNAVYDEAADDYSKAVNLRSMMENGLKLTDRLLSIGDTRLKSKKAWFQKYGLFDLSFIDAFDTPENQVNKIKQIKPDAILGYPSQLNLICRHIRDEGIKGINPRVVYTTAEYLSPEVRELINSTFGLELSDLFGCIEVNRTAWECPEHTGYHLDMDSVHTEFIKDEENASSGEKGSIVYTCLYNYAMPLIRYEVGDIGTPTDRVCDCGRSLPLMESVEGRSDDYITLPSGRKISPLALACGVMKHTKEIKEYQIMQETKNRMIVYLAVTDKYGKDDEESLVKEIRQKLNNEIDPEIKIIDKIPRTMTGKIRAIGSKVK